MNGGGHLASYGKLAEQKEVEQHYISRGLLLPHFHKQYWLGLSSTTKTYPKFRWKDPKVLALDAPGAYVNWGIMVPQNKKEPFAIRPPELCGAANFSEMSMGVGGWSDSNCNNAFAFVCKIRSFDSYPDCEVTSSGVQVCFNARPATFDEAESVCAKQCGHLVSYTTQAEQYEVENIYISNVGSPAPARARAGPAWADSSACARPACMWSCSGCPGARLERSSRPTGARALPQGDLIPNFHIFYWMGLKVNGTWPNFDWVDPYISGPAGYYTNWGITKPDQEPEPSRPDIGFAAGANYTEVQRSPPVWGWSDQDPGVKHIFICRTSGECSVNTSQGQPMAAVPWQQKKGGRRESSTTAFVPILIRGKCTFTR
jgi:hypothetical protein